MTKFTKANWMTRQLAENLCVMGEQLKMARMRFVGDVKSPVIRCEGSSKTGVTTQHPYGHE